MSVNGLSINDLMSIFNKGKQVLNKEQIKPLAETLLPLVGNLLNKSNQTSNNEPSISDLATMLKNVIDQQALPKEELKKIERKMKKALEKDGINGALEYLSKKLKK